MGVEGAASRGIATDEVTPPVVIVTAESVDAPSAETPANKSTVDERNDSGIVRVIFTGVSGIT